MRRLGSPTSRRYLFYYWCWHCDMVGSSFSALANAFTMLRQLLAGKTGLTCDAVSCRFLTSAVFSSWVVPRSTTGEISSLVGLCAFATTDFNYLQAIDAARSFSHVNHGQFAAATRRLGRVRDGRQGAVILTSYFAFPTQHALCFPAN